MSSPKPWQYNPETGEVLDAYGNRVICPTDPSENVHDDDLDVWIAEDDARLIAAANDLLKALQKLLQYSPHYTGEMCCDSDLGAYIEARAAIKKATEKTEA